jgi:perosamine synthetase
MKKEKIINQMEPWYGEEEIQAVTDYLRSGGWLMEFKKTRELEQMICNFTGAKYCSVVANGTVSLFIALKAVGIKMGDEVIVPDFTMIATPNAVVLAGATPVMVDVDNSICLDIEKVKKAITKKTKAVMHVSINGRAGKLKELKTLCDKKGLVLIEDAAQSIGSFYKGKHLGTYGAIGSFSFSVPKIITMGQGGALITDDEGLYKKICKIKDFGRIRGGVDIHDELGWNFKFTDLQSVFGIEQMKKLPSRVKRKKKMGIIYRKLLKGVKQVRFIETDFNDVVPWFIEILVQKREKLIDYLKSQNIGSRVFYPAIHTQKIYSKIKGRFPNATKFGQNGLWLPSSSNLEDDDIKYIAKTIRKFYEKH